MDSQVQQIKDKLNVLDVVGSYLKLTKTGINYRGVCPFHKEKSPSFFVSPTRQMWHCFGCGKGGSIFDFVMGIEGVEFGDALRLLAQKAGIELKRENPQLRTERQRLHEICDLACLFFEKQMEASVAGKEAAQYLQGRGITSESLKVWRVGYSPDTWNGLTDFLIGKGYLRQEIVKAGLAIQKENNQNDSYDRFRGRIMFPVFGVNGEVLGFGGRVFKQQGETAKYINTPQTLLYDKSSILYGLHKAKLSVRKQNQCVITEGYTDVIMCHQAGFENVVAASGTALTMQHLTLLKRYTDNLILAFDMDVAGDNATKRGILNAQAQGFNLKIIEHYGEGHAKSDPADIILKDPGIWKIAVEKAKGIMDYYLDSAFAAFDAKTPEGKKGIGAIVLSPIKRLPNKIEQAHWVSLLADRLHIKEEVILEELAKVKSDTNLPMTFESTNAVASESVGTESRKKLIEEKIVALILKDPAHIESITPEVRALFFPNAQAVLALVGAWKTKAEGTLADAIKASDLDEAAKHELLMLQLRADSDYPDDGQEEFALCLFQLKQLELKNRLNRVALDIKEAEQVGDADRVGKLMEEFRGLSKEL